MQGHFSCPGLGLHFFAPRGALCCQAMAAWQWFNSLSRRVSAGRRVLRLNLDETSVCMWQGAGKGTLFHSRKRHGPRDEPVQVASRQQRRLCMTHVAIICDDPAIQPLLPQFFIGNQKVFPKREWGAVQASCPSNVVLVRQQSSWNNTKLFTIIVNRLGVVLRPFLCSVQPVLLMDTCRLHFAKPAVAACFSASIWPVFVPAKMTWLLQPCDTHLFADYKRQLRCSYQAARAKTARGNLNIVEFMSCLYTVLRSVLQGHRWSLAFDRDGFGSSQAEVSNSVKRQLGIDGDLDVPAGMPSHEQLRLCFPRRAKLSITSMLPPEIPTMALPRQPVGLRLVPRVQLALRDAVPRCDSVSFGEGPGVRRSQCSCFLAGSLAPGRNIAKPRRRKPAGILRAASRSVLVQSRAGHGPVPWPSIAFSFVASPGLCEQRLSLLTQCVGRAASQPSV